MFNFTTNSLAVTDAWLWQYSHCHIFCDWILPHWTLRKRIWRNSFLPIPFFPWFHMGPGTPKFTQYFHEGPIWYNDIPRMCHQSFSFKPIATDVWSVSKYQRHNSAVLGYVSMGEAANVSLWSLLGTLSFVWL